MTLTRPNYHNGTTIQIVINIEQFNIQVTESNNRPASKYLTRAFFSTPVRCSAVVRSTAAVRCDLQFAVINSSPLDCSSPRVTVLCRDVDWVRMPRAEYRLSKPAVYRPLSLTSDLKESEHEIVTSSVYLKVVGSRERCSHIRFFIPAVQRKPCGDE